MTLRRTSRIKIGRWIKLSTHGEIGQIRTIKATDKSVNRKYLPSGGMDTGS